METKEVKRTFVNSEMPKSLAHQARVTAARLEISRSELIRLAVKDYLAKLAVESGKESSNVQQPA